ncbi:TonB-dependent receptor [Asticcacaulis sp. SL142]|nr:TonB-dependent receptor [Asticcacaulis sp. SL142]WAC49926.1 TonB-dependent receptor [Asticcacaulis sp. SL142]
MGKSSTEYQRDLSQVVTGFEGDLPGLFRDHDWTWSGYYSYGKTEETIQDRNSVSNERYMRALDAVSGPGGTPICSVNSDADTSNDDPNCVALNPFKPLTQDVIDYMTFNPSASKSSLEQQVFSAYATGGLFTLPAGEVQAVIGAEYRKEKNHIGAVAEYDPNNPAYVPDYGVVQNPLIGEFDVKEAFGELSVPILADLPFAYKLSVDAAMRASDYSTAGKTTSYKYGLQYAPVRDLRLRATYGKAVRAPNISEVFTASSVSGQWLYDPCNYYMNYRVETTADTKANCAALSPTNSNFYWLWTDVEKKGNPDLKVETAKTLTVGLVAQPRFMKNLTMSVDYYDIDLSDVIASIEPQTIINKCIDNPMDGNPYCDLVVREAGTNNLIGVVKQNINLAKRTNRGIDMEFDYFVDLSAWGWGSKSGRLAVNSVYTRLLENKITPDPDNPQNVTDTLGVFGFPEWKGVTRVSYANGPLWLSWNLRHYSPMRMNTTITPENYHPYKTKPVFYSDVYAYYQLKPNVNIGVGISNVFDTPPPRYPGAEAGGAYFGDEGWQSGVFDVIGQSAFVTLKFKR